MVRKGLGAPKLEFLPPANQASLNTMACSSDVAFQAGNVTQIDGAYKDGHLLL